MSLGWLLTEHWNRAEADFERFYHRDLRVEVERMPARRMWALLLGLPPESAVAAIEPPRSSLRAGDSEGIARAFGLAV